MSLIDKFLDVMRLNEDDDDDDYEFANDDYLDDDEDYNIPKKKAPRYEKKVEPKNGSKERERKPEKERETVKPTTRITPIGRSQRKQETGNTSMEVCVIKPTAIEDELEITETLLKGRTVIVNMEGLNVEIAQRIIDFTSGSCFAIGGNVQKISHYIFIITPATVDVSGDFQNLFGGSFESPLSTDL